MEINGKEIAVEQQGDGDAVVMVHGLGGTANSWYPQVGPLARFFRVVRLHLASSRRPPPPPPVSPGWPAPPPRPPAPRPPRARSRSPPLPPT